MTLLVHPFTQKQLLGFRHLVALLQDEALQKWGDLKKEVVIPRASRFKRDLVNQCSDSQLTLEAVGLHLALCSHKGHFQLRCPEVEIKPKLSFRIGKHEARLRGIERCLLRGGHDSPKVFLYDNEARSGKRIPLGIGQGPAHLCGRPAKLWSNLRPIASGEEEEGEGQDPEGERKSCHR